MARPTPRPVPTRPSTPSISSGIATRPTPRPARPNTPAVQNRPGPDAKSRSVPRPGTLPGGDFKLPGNFQRPSQIAKPNRPAVTRPADLGKIGGKIGGKDGPKIGGKIGGKDGPKIGGKIGGKDIGKKPGVRPGGDLVGLPTNRPTQPITRPKGPKGPSKDFTNKWQNAIGGGKKFKPGTKIGNIDVDLSRNVNYQNLNRHRSNINNNFRNYRGAWFNAGWWDRNSYYHRWPHWHYHHYHPSWYWWRHATWPLLTSWMFVNAWSPPIYYDYGSNVVIQQDVVYVNEQPVASAPVFAQQAIELADVEPPPEDAQIEWMSLGTWAMMATKDDDDPSVILQLAVTKDGLVSGTWYNRATDATSDVEGRVDPETQRIALRKPDEPDVVLEVGAYNLTQDATSCLIHYGTLNTQTRWLVRLEEQQKE